MSPAERVAGAVCCLVAIFIIAIYLRSRKDDQKER
jgi:hypothetical protein